MVLREASSADLATLVALVHAAFAEYHGRLDPPSGAETETEDTLRRALERGGAALACRDDEAIGCVFYHREGDAVYFGRLSVAPSFRGHGVGEALTAYVERQARAMGVARIQLGFRLALPYLQMYYERLGYHVVRRESHPGYAVATYAVMEKRVG
jgi:ribosomal protein S18 acetylase RimI-like enzyme